jgi:hypothetical protein
MAAPGLFGRIPPRARRRAIHPGRRTAAEVFVGELADLVDMDIAAYIRPPITSTARLHSVNASGTTQTSRHASMRMRTDKTCRHRPREAFPRRAQSVRFAVSGITISSVRSNRKWKLTGRSSLRDGGRCGCRQRTVDEPHGVRGRRRRVRVKPRKHSETAEDQDEANHRQQRAHLHVGKHHRRTSHTASASSTSAGTRHPTSIYTYGRTLTPHLSSARSAPPPGQPRGRYGTPRIRTDSACRTGRATPDAVPIPASLSRFRPCAPGHAPRR